MVLGICASDSVSILSEDIVKVWNVAHDEGQRLSPGRVKSLTDMDFVNGMSGKGNREVGIGGL